MQQKVLYDYCFLYSSELNWIELSNQHIESKHLPWLSLQIHLFYINLLLNSFIPSIIKTLKKYPDFQNPYLNTALKSSTFIQLCQIAH